MINKLCSGLKATAQFIYEYQQNSYALFVILLKI